MKENKQEETAIQKEGCKLAQVFNPPYVPTPDDEIHQPGVATAWAGGFKGRRVIDRVLPQVLRACLRVCNGYCARVWLKRVIGCVLP
jgi:methylase of polypeptide subunit release factors